MRNAMCPLLAGGAAAMLCHTAVAAPPRFIGIGDLPGQLYWSHAYAVSPEGDRFAGQSISAGQVAPAVRWTEQGGMVELEDPPGGSNLSIARAVSSLGEDIVGTIWLLSGNQFAFHWTAPGTMTTLPLPDGHAAALGADISNDGSVIVGSSGPTASSTEAFRWTAQDGIVGLGFFPGGAHSVAKAVSADGLVVAGLARRSNGLDEAFRWTEATGLVGLGSLPGGSGFVRSSAEAVSADGSVIVGRSNSGLGHQAFRWTAAGGMVGLGTGYQDSTAHDVSADGSVTVGTAAPPGTIVRHRAVIWYGEDPIARDLQTMLETDYGMDLTGWTLTSANGVSADGMTICGHGTNPNGDTEGWVAILFSSCAVDWDESGVVNSTDIAAYLTSWLADIMNGTSEADFDGSGATNSSDISAFLTAWLDAIAEPC